MCALALSDCRSLGYVVGELSPLFILMFCNGQLSQIKWNIILTILISLV